MPDSSAALAKVVASFPLAFFADGSREAMRGSSDSESSSTSATVVDRLDRLELLLKESVEASANTEWTRRLVEMGLKGA